ncbi:hypothetical protein HZC08_00795 [Candidatus Micrarchaeota archaeon]|nr:hypothetical protein [Candidatus Micrarchaeota archaeon]
MGKVTIHELARIIELRKKLNETNFKIAALRLKMINSQDLRNEASAIQEEIGKIERELNSGGIEILIPNSDKLEKLNSEIGTYTEQQILEAMGSKAGKLYELLVERAKITKANYGNRYEIAKISLLANKHKEAKTMLSGNNAEMANQKVLEIAQRIVKRLGIAGVSEPSIADEAEVLIDNRKFWVPSALLKQAGENGEKIGRINAKIQLKNAERQVKKFSEEEEKEFEKMQGEYLALLRERDGMIAEYIKEEKEITEI